MLTQVYFFPPVLGTPLSPYMHIDTLNPKPPLFDLLVSPGWDEGTVVIRPSVLIPRCFLCISPSLLNSAQCLSPIPKAVPSPHEPPPSCARLPTRKHLGFPPPLLSSWSTALHHWKTKEGRWHTGAVFPGRKVFCSCLCIYILVVPPHSSD